MALPAGFRFGVATASYQIEGAVAEGGRAPSIWDTFSHTPGRTALGQSGDTACDHYHRWPEDLDLMKDLGIDTYRLSLSWSRILPMGRGAVNPQGVAFYRELLAGLKERGIRPAVTLYHWDLPQALQDEGGWVNRATSAAFAEYARVAARELGDLVDFWITLNEPWCTAFLGYASGVHAPGHSDPLEALTAAHHLNLAHGLGTQALRAELGAAAQVGISLNIHVTRPEDPNNDRHLAAVRRIDQLGNHIFLGPLLDGSYPSELIQDTRDITDWSFVREGDLALARQRIDVLGLNYYTVQVVRPADGQSSGSSGGHGQGAASPWVGCDDVEFLEPEGPTTEMGWGIHPDGLRDLLGAFARHYPNQPLMISENGAAFPDELLPAGAGAHGARVLDPRRVEYLASHLAAVEEAITDGADVRGYLLWSFMDNFEWAHGYRPRFGIVYIDFETLERIPKDSYYWYQQFIARARAEAGAVGKQEPEEQPAGRAKPATRLWSWLGRRESE